MASNTAALPAPCWLPAHPPHAAAALHACTSPLQLIATRRRYEVRVPKEEADMVGDMGYSWRKLKKAAVDVADTLATVQARRPLGWAAGLCSG